MTDNQGNRQRLHADGIVPAAKRRLPKIVRRIAWAAVILLLAWPTGDWIYSRWTRQRYRSWFDEQEWDTDGILKGCRAFEIPAATANAVQDSTGMLLVHGFADSPQSWRPIAGMLAKQGIACRAMRLPGSARPLDGTKRDYLSEWRQALAREMADMKTRHRRVFAAGHSLGGALILQYAMEHPDELEGILLLAPLIRVSSERSPLLPPHTWFRGLRPLLHFTRFLENPFPLELENPAALRHLSRERFIPLGVYEGLFELLEDLAEDPLPIETPIMLVTSATDPVVDSVRAENFLTTRHATGIEHMQLERSGHPVHLDLHWQDIAAAMARFAMEQP